MIPGPDVASRLVLPAIWTPDTSQAQWEEELWTAVEASLALGAFLNGHIDADQYMDAIADIGIDPLSLEEVLEDVPEL